MDKRAVQITDTTLRDAHQSLWATRMRTGDMLPILGKLDEVGYWSLEAWGGATFDACLRFLDEDPWKRLRTIKAHCPKTPLQMLLRGQNLVGYKHYSDELVHRFVPVAKRNGVEVFRVFDALNDIRNIKTSAAAIKECGAHFQGTISYTISPVHTIDSFVEYAQNLKELGADSICIKDMAGILVPYRAERLVKRLVSEVGLPVQVHCHYIGGMAPMNYLKSIEAGAATVDTAAVALAFGNSQPAVEMIVAALKDSPYDTGIDLKKLFEVAHYWEAVREANDQRRGKTTLLLMEVFSHQVPGGMMSNLVSQLEVQEALHLLPDVLKEIAVVRKEVGYPPLVTPTSQIVGVQAVMNVLTGRRWDVVPSEMRNYLLGNYGQTPGEVDPKVLDKVFGADKKPTEEEMAAGHSDTTTYAEIEAEIGSLAKTEEDVLMYAMFPNEGRAYLEKHEYDKNYSDIYTSADMPPTVRVEEDDDMNLASVKELIKMLDKSDAAEVIIEEGDSRITVRKPGAMVAPVVTATGSGTPANVTVEGGSASKPAADCGDSGDGSVGERPSSWKAIEAPMVGTYYSAASPEAEPFVKVDDTVAAGDVVCIVEAMKLMNELTVAEPGVIKAITVENGAAVGCGDALVWYEPANV